MFDAEAKYIPLEAIIDYLTGSATQQTLDEVSEWCAFSPENETYFRANERDMVLNSGRTT